MFVRKATRKKIEDWRKLMENYQSFEHFFDNSLIVYLMLQIPI